MDAGFRASSAHFLVLQALLGGKFIDSCSVALEVAEDHATADRGEPESTVGDLEPIVDLAVDLELDALARAFDGDVGLSAGVLDRPRIDPALLAADDVLEEHDRRDDPRHEVVPIVLERE